MSKFENPRHVPLSMFVDHLSRSLRSAGFTHFAKLLGQTPPYLKSEFQQDDQRAVTRVDAHLAVTPPLIRLLVDFLDGFTMITIGAATIPTHCRDDW
jgi:hypothetical protein